MYFYHLQVCYQNNDRIKKVLLEFLIIDFTLTLFKNQIAIFYYRYLLSEYTSTDKLIIIYATKRPNLLNLYILNKYRIAKTYTV